MNHKTWPLTLGSVVAASISLAPIVQAAENPFAMRTLAAPSLVAEAGEKMKDGKCGEGKCSGKRKAVESKAKDGNCGANKMKEGGCSASKMKEGGCSGSKTMEKPAPAKP